MAFFVGVAQNHPHLQHSQSLSLLPTFPHLSPSPDVIFTKEEQRQLLLIPIHKINEQVTEGKYAKSHF